MAALPVERKTVALQDEPHLAMFTDDIKRVIAELLYSTRKGDPEVKHSSSFFGAKLAAEILLEKEMDDFLYQYKRVVKNGDYKTMQALMDSILPKIELAFKDGAGGGLSVGVGNKLIDLILLMTPMSLRLLDLLLSRPKLFQRLDMEARTRLVVSVWQWLAQLSDTERQEYAKRLFAMIDEHALGHTHAVRKFVEALRRANDSQLSGAPFLEHMVDVEGETGVFDDPVNQRQLFEILWPRSGCTRASKYDDVFRVIFRRIVAGSPIEAEMVAMGKIADEESELDRLLRPPPSDGEPPDYKAALASMRQHPTYSYKCTFPAVSVWDSAVLYDIPLEQEIDPAYHDFLVYMMSRPNIEVPRPSDVMGAISQDADSPTDPGHILMLRYLRLADEIEDVAQRIKVLTRAEDYFEEECGRSNEENCSRLLSLLREHLNTLDRQRQ